MIYPGLVDAALRYHDQDYFLRLLESRMPRAYIAALKEGDGDGYALLQVIAKVAERVSIAIGRLERDSLLASSYLGIKSVGSILAWRTDVTGAVTLLAGTTVVSTQTGRRYKMLASMALSNGEMSNWYAQYVIAEAPGYEWDSKAGFYGKSGDFIDGCIDAFETVLTSPATDPSIWMLSHLDDTTGGRAPSMETHGVDLGAPARETSTDALAYYQQVVGAEDTVSYLAIYRGLLPLLMPYGYAPIIHEGGGASMRGLFLDAGTHSDTDPDLCYALDMDATDGWKVLLSYEESRGFLLIEVPYGLADSIYAACWDTAFAKHAGGVALDMVRI